MKISIITPVSFVPNRQEINVGIDNFDIRKLYAIINQTKSQIIYATGKSGFGFTNISNSVVTLEYDTTSHASDDIIQILYEDNSEQKLLETILYFISSMVEKMPRVDDKDRQIVSVETGTVGISSLPTLNTLVSLQSFSGGNTSAIPNQISNIGAAHIYDNIKIT